MSAPAVLKAVYATWRPVPTRKVLQLVFEVPIEQTEIAMKTLGIPDVGESLWCAIARLQETQAQPEPSAAAPNNAIPIKQGKRFSELRKSAQAALKLQDPAFCEWLYAKHRADVTRLEKQGRIKEGGLYADYADTVLKVVLNIISKTDLDKFPQAGANWEKMLTTYETESRYGIS